MIDLGFKVDIRQVERLLREFPRETEEVVHDTLKVIAARLEAEVAEATPKGVGGAAGLMGSIHGETRGRGVRMSAVIGTPLEYAPVVEMGRRPGQRQPPSEPLALWARRKLGVSAEEAKGVGYVIARKIGREGFKGAKMFERTLARRDRWIMSQFNAVPARIRRRVGA